MRCDALALCLGLALAGCQSWSPQRGVDPQNNFHSTRYPEVSISTPFFSALRAPQIGSNAV